MQTTTLPTHNQTTKPNFFKRYAPQLILGSSIMFFIGILLTCILVPLSFGYLSYDEMGLLKGRINGKVDTSTVYVQGRHVIGPAYTFQKYPSSAQTIYQPSVSLVSSDKLETDIAITIIYFIDPKQLGQLQQEFNLRYATVVQSRALSAIKNAGVQFTTQQFFQNRSLVTDTLHAAIKADLETNLYVKVPFFYIGLLNIPPLVSQKQSQTAIQNQINAQQQYENQASLVRKDTTTLANALLNNGTIIQQQATAEAASQISQASSSAYQTVETARSQSLQNLFTTLCVTNSTHMSQIDYAFTLLHSNPQLHVGYDTLFKTLSS